MFEDFADTKRQLSELATIVNKFKSESVQLRVVELLFAALDAGEAGTSKGRSDRTTVNPRKPPKKRAAPSGSKTAANPRKKGVRKSKGAVATLIEVYEAGFFQQPRTISDICTHCETNLAKKIKPNEISGKLGRMVRNGELKRSKNSDKQYEYKEA